MEMDFLLEGQCAARNKRFYRDCRAAGCDTRITELTITAAPASVLIFNSSPPIHQPKNTAITGLTYAYVDTA